MIKVISICERCGMKDQVLVGEDKTEDFIIETKVKIESLLLEMGWIQSQAHDEGRDLTADEQNAIDGNINQVEKLRAKSNL